ncbi:MAG: hypothetical protein Q7S13_06815, partial [Candidatus Omnitrophota bacterium]|nr:hypothetical protein [Candidatus Omnitrophota bacterium]
TPQVVIIYQTPPPLKEITDAEIISYQTRATFQWRTSESSNAKVKIYDEFGFSAELQSMNKFFHATEFLNLGSFHWYKFIITPTDLDGNGYKEVSGKFQTTQFSYQSTNMEL